jgi:hypothetical protein
VGAFGSKLSGVLAPGTDLSAATEAAAKEPMNRDREEALQLAARSAETLALLAGGGKTDVSPAAEPLTGTLADRPDAVILPALDVLQFVGGPAHVSRIASVLGSSERAETVRARAARALSGVFSRSGTAEGEVIQMLQDVAQKDAAFEVRAATAGALGRLNLTKEARFQLMRALLGH